MIEPATVHFENGKVISAVRVGIKDSGWVAVNADNDGWTYHPPRKIDRIVSRRGDTTSE